MLEIWRGIGRAVFARCVSPIVAGAAAKGMPCWVRGMPGAMDLDMKLFLRSEEHTSELQSRQYLVCRLLLEKKKINEAETRSTADRYQCSTRGNISVIV